MTNISASGANISGLVNAGDLSTNVKFEYGTSSSYGDTILAIQNPVTGSTDKGITADITGLSASTLYHYRIVATNGPGTV